MSQPEPTATPKATRARPGREVAEAGERRRRSGVDKTGRRLFVDESQLDTNFRYYWALNDAARIYQLTQQDDYNVVTPEEIGGVKTEHQLRGGDGDGRPLGQVLLKKRMDWHLNDRAEEERALEGRMEAVKHGERVLSEDGDSAEKTYKPKVNNQLGESNEVYRP